MIPSNYSCAALYIRVSLDEQARYGFSIEGQVTELKQYCKTNRLDIHDIYIDAGASGGKIAGRPELRRLLEDADRSKFNQVLIWRLSRLSRSLRDMLSIVERLNRNKVLLYSLNEHFDTSTPLGQFVLQMFGAAAELERSNIADNVRSAMNQRSKRGIWNAGNSVLGYRWVRDSTTNLGKVQVVHEEAELVNRIFEWYASGKLGFKAISNRLNKSDCRTKLGNPFSVQSVRRILNNRNYIGLVQFNKTEHIRTHGVASIGWAEGEHEAIVDLELWQRVQTLLTKRFASPVRKVDRSFPLTGLLKCPCCGKSMVPWHSNRRRKDGTCRTNHYYLCSTYNSKGLAACRPNVIRADKVELWFFEQLRKLLSESETLEKIVTATNAKQHINTLPSLEEDQNIEKRLKELDLQKEKLFHSFETGRISRDEFASSIDEVKLRVKEAEASKERLNTASATSENARIKPEQVRAALSHLRQIFESSSEEQQKRLLRLLIEKITLPVNRDIQRLTIHCSNSLLNLNIPTLTEVRNP